MNTSLTSAASAPFSPTPWRLVLFMLLGVPCASLRAAEPALDHHVITVTVTAYSSEVKQTDRTPYHGAWGDRLDAISPGQRALAVSPDLLREGLSRGQHVRLKGYKGEFIILDKTPGRWTHRVDIHMGLDKAAARRFGRKKAQLSWTTPRSGKSAAAKP